MSPADWGFRPRGVDPMTRAVRNVIPSVVCLFLAAAPPAVAAESAVTLDPAASRLTFVLDSTWHEVHGSMAVTGGSIRFDPATGEAAGTITVDATSAKTGNSMRDKTMHKEVLETGKFPTIAFKIQRVEGKPADPGHSDLRLVGVMSLHGVDHPMTLKASVDITGGRAKGEMRFAIPYVEWGLKDPSFILARAAKTVDVTVVAEGPWSATSAAPR
jgi:polyisoprenoid-binding protein YceI